MYFSANDTIYCSILAVLTLFGIAANLLLLYMIICRSPQHLSPYRIFLGNTALTQLLLSASLLITSPRIFPQGYYIVNIYLGPVQLLTPWCCYMLYITMLHLAVNSFVSLMVSMIYRCISLRNAVITSCIALQMCFAGYLIPFSMVASCVSMEYSADKSQAAELTHHLIANIEKYAVVVAARILQPCVIWNIICCSIFLLPVYATMYLCRWKILNYLNKVNYVQSSHNKLNIKRFVKALTIQSLVPTLSIFPPAIAYLLIQFGTLQPHLISYFIAPCLSIGPVLDPLITIYYVSPYRHLVESLFFVHSDASGSNQSGSQMMPSRSQSLKPAMFSIKQVV
ncbi:unnamed protein product [Cylicocyclus nassatus]|uniref:G-protein coupled receptors family 1 profile domain-containing protein n=1 Tax=Cylicocyclus nassatus TaxID=53992 RepID=A0AA36DKM8_CYLNA|nr:unnamed protein product [Cylicocyclus nassatus]